MRDYYALFAMAACICACGGDDVLDEPKPPQAPEECATEERLLDDGSCLPPGVSACAGGFESDGLGGCVAILPAAACPPGEMAIPGETACRPVAPCPTGPWPEMDVTAVVVYVDALAGGVGDGSMSQPFITLGAAVAAAPAGAVIAMAAGSYATGLVVDKPLTFWGACPALVELRTPPTSPAFILPGGADGTVFRDLAITGGSHALAVTNTVDMLV